ncbi:helix-turn-helix transcriptional regulator [Streptomyces sp. SCSIO 30461]|uniref:helix-turn-helix domain-containing protein n=1 Tax=Streptomyces sp. SCSIO 30461 TaxID=3118085 RepID=UPI0030D1CC4D
MAARCGLAHSTLSKAAAGSRVPTWPVTEAFISSLNALSTAEAKEDLDTWFESWTRAKQREESEPAAPSRRRRANPPRPYEPAYRALAANPHTAGTAEAFILQLRMLQAWSGLSFVQLSRRAAKGTLPTSTISDTLRRKKLPKWSFVEAFVSACGGSGTDTAAWGRAWELVKAQELLGDAPALSDGARRAEQGLNAEEATGQVAQTLDHLRHGASIPKQPTWLRKAVEEETTSTK